MAEASGIKSGASFRPVHFAPQPAWPCNQVIPETAFVHPRKLVRICTLKLKHYLLGHRRFSLGDTDDIRRRHRVSTTDCRGFLALAAFFRGHDILSWTNFVRPP